MKRIVPLKDFNSELDRIFSTADQHIKETTENINPLADDYVYSEKNKPKNNKKPRRFVKILLSIILILGAIILIGRAITSAYERRIIGICEDTHWSGYYNGTLCQDYLYLKPVVKRSVNMICHRQGTTYYYRTKNYKIYDSMDKCLNSGGRRPYN